MGVSHIMCPDNCRGDVMKNSIKIWFLYLLIHFIVGCSSPQVRFAAIGDTPYYSIDSELLVVTNVLNNMHSEGIPFVVHVGDIIRGGTSCSESLFKMRANVFSKSPIPFLITIGDNEFNDCKDPIKARNQFRNIILNNPPVNQIISGVSQGTESIHVTRQREMIENAAWRYKDVSFIMLALPDIPGIFRLKPAVLNDMLNHNIKYLVDNFNKAKKNNSHAVVVIMHSNPMACRIDLCVQMLRILKEQITLFEKPVLLLNGSIHEQIFEGPGYMELKNLWHLRPGSEPGESWPEIIFSKPTNLFSVKFHSFI